MKRVSPRIPAFKLHVRSFPAGDIPISCRVRLARNLSDHVFPSRASDAELGRVYGAIEKVVRQLSADRPFDEKLAMNETAHLSKSCCQFFYERHLLSRESCDQRPGTGFITNHSSTLVALVNEEDHLRIQGFAPGFDLRSAWKTADAFDDQLSAELHYAWTPRLGYLTACPSNVGTGLRASVMLHLAGLHLTNELESSTRALERLHLQLRGTNGEGSDAIGQMVQISNAQSLGVTDEAIIAQLERVCGALITQETNARKRLVRTMPLIVADTLERAYAILSSARLLSAEEATELLAAMRFGASLNLVRGLTVALADHWILTIQPSHLEEIAGKEMDSDSRDAYRAELLRKEMPRYKLLF